MVRIIKHVNIYQSDDRVSLSSPIIQALILSILFSFLSLVMTWSQLLIPCNVLKEHTFVAWKYYSKLLLIDVLARRCEIMLIRLLLSVI